MNASGGRRYPVDAKGIGLIQHGRQKTYMMSVLWSDSNNIIIYRTFEEFKKLDKELRRRFPIEAGWFKRSERVIPTFKDAALFRRARDSNRYMERLKLLEVYSRDLLQTNPKVSQCEDVTQFYTPQSRDFDPSFHDNSIVILPSDAGDGKKETPTLLTEAPVTQRIKSDQHECVEAFEAKDTKNRPFKAKKGDFLDVLLKDTTGWWLVENEEKHLAWFPAPFLKKNGPTEELVAGRKSQHGGVLYFATKSYEAKSSDEVSVDIGVIVEVVEKSDNGWWLVWYNGRAGYIPSMYLKPYTNPHQRFQVNQGTYTSTPNLVKASSSTLNVAVSTNQRAFEEDPVQEKAASKRQEERKAVLNRRKSRSLNGLPVSEVQTYKPKVALEMDRLQGGPSEAKGRTPNSKWKPIPRPRKVLIDQSPENELLSEHPGALVTRAHARRRPHHGSSEQRKDSGSNDSSSTSDSDTLQPSSDADTDSDSATPVVPPRPQVEEILKNCTPVTKRAVQKTERYGVVW